MNRPDFLACETFETTLLLGRLAETAAGDAAAHGVPLETLLFAGEDETETNPWIRLQVAAFERA